MAFVALNEGAGTAFCWGGATQYGGDCDGKDFTGRKHIFSTAIAFVATKAGSGFCWGKDDRGGSCDTVDFTHMK
jgi:hypothetical protein